ncbi:MAG: hypothetical protein M1821_003588 [Bathelium mastoideum]|nr:MAG: hypothetical protein M1821_003588 [Bathelium mastoideum]
MANSRLGVAIPAPPTFPFLKLPTELRLKVYRFLFPDKPVSYEREALLREDEEPCYMEILRTSRSIYQEATEILYGTVPFLANFECCGCTAGVMKTSLACPCGICCEKAVQRIRPALSKIRHLNITVGSHPAFRVEPILALQEALFEFVDALKSNGRLRTLKILFHYKFGDDLGSKDQHDWIRYAYHQDPEYEQHGEISAEKHAAYMLEPFFQLRGLTQLQERGGFEVKVDGFTDTPRLQPLVNDMILAITGNDPVNLTWPMRRAWEAFEALVDYMKPKVACPYSHLVYDLVRKMQFSIFRGNIEQYVLAQKEALLFLTNPKYRRSSTLPGKSRGERAVARGSVRDQAAEIDKLLREARANAISQNDTTFSLPRLIQEEENKQLSAHALSR